MTECPAPAPYSDPLNHGLLNHPETEQAARDIVDGLVAGLPERVSLYALLRALGSIFIGLCDDHDIDTDGAFEQVQDATFRNPATFAARLAHLERRDAR